MTPRGAAARKKKTWEAEGRLLSLDALRGFDMFWLIGAGWLFGAVSRLSDNPVIQTVMRQLEHSEWEGLAFQDLVFPLFIFIVGVSLVFSVSRSRDTAGCGAAVTRILRRGVLLYLLGIFYYGGLSGSLSDIRFVGVLQRIAACYTAAALAFCFLSTRWIAVLAAALLAGYWALMTFIPVPGAGAGSFTEGANLADYIDKIYLPGRKLCGDHDPEGLLSTLPAIASCLMGVLAGILLTSPRLKPVRKVAWLCLAGAVAVILGHLWGTQFPIIKKIWTSSYALATAGYGCLLLALFYIVIEVWNLRAWTAPFAWIGANAISVYIAWNIVDFGGIAARIAGGEFAKALGAWSDPVAGLVVIGINLAVLRFLYVRRIFIRL